ncbi:helix-turn-helix transcriptional regulator [Paenibacillus donghaensis]|uniref:helix-turn-helix domain-containing protein n=1 Tax=Paenibacillus donghaensis TaxID=414771 RepID=UPI0018838529|nr:helix-turn-helix transcriptional regulator [Paenibacillus donghaensis]MBE9916649.1 helix-turn-helix transcriptional regulator [Paenibacillus donghaensis]
MEAAIIKTIGELIHDARCTLNITLTQLSELSGIYKETISSIEKGDVTQPEFRTILPLARVLNIPFEKLVDYYVEVETRSNHLICIYQAALTQGSSTEVIRKVAAKYLESNDDRLDLIEKLFESIDSIEDISIKISLYDLIIDYSRLHGIMPYIAKGMYQKYLIERNDFSRLKETYYIGKYVLNYVDFLSIEEQIELYYKLGVHAYNLRLYHESIKHCKGVLRYDGENLHKVNALVILRDAYFDIGEYTESELYAIQYKQFNFYPHTRENIILMEALYNAKKGHVGQAVEQLTAFLETCSNDYAILATIHLLQLYLQKGSLNEAEAVLSNCKIDSSLINKRNPFVYAIYADFLKIQGDYYLAVGKYEQSITYLLEGALYYSKVNDTVKEKECLSRIMQIHLEHNVPPQSTFKKLNSYYTNEKEMEG